MKTYLLYSPEREDSGNMQFSAVNILKVMGGATEACKEVGIALYRAVVEKVVPVSSTIAEFSKLLENIYRSVNIGLVNELKMAAIEWVLIFGKSLVQLRLSLLASRRSTLDQDLAGTVFQSIRST